MARALGAGHGRAGQVHELRGRRRATSSGSVAGAGPGNSSPIVWGDRIFLTTAHDDGRAAVDDRVQRADGRKLWETFVPQDGVEHVHQKNGHASATPVTDGQLRLRVVWRHGLVAFDMNGKIVWHRKFGAIDNYHGPAGSPVLYKDRLFLYQDQDGSRVADRVRRRVRREDGQDALGDAADAKPWAGARRSSINAGDRDELVVIGPGPRGRLRSGRRAQELWTVRGMTFEVIPTPVVGHGLVFASSGRAGPTLAIRPGGTGDVTSTHVAWSTPKGSPVRARPASCTTGCSISSTTCRAS